VTEQEFKQYVEQLGINIPEEQLQQLNKFYLLLVEWNQKINLTRITDQEEVYLKHFYDSLTLTRVIDLKKVETLCDVGTGAGFPGIVLKIIFPHLKITLIDSLLKRVNYLNEIIKNLELTDIKAIHSRGEDHKETYDLVTARAVARLDKLLDYCFPLVNKGGSFIAMKANLTDEVEEASKKLTKYKVTITKIDTFKLPKEDSNRTLVMINRE